MLQAFSSLMTVAMVSALAAVSPGPDFFIVVKNSLSYSRRIGMLTALGVSLALLIHLSYTLVGIGILTAESSTLYKVLKYAGAGYLFYLGSKGVVASFKKQAPLHFMSVRESTELPPLSALKQGFLTNLLNPKCALFFISLFSQFIFTDTPVSQKLSYAGLNWSITLGWFLLLSYLVTGKYLTSKIAHFRNLFDRVMGMILIALSLKLFVS